MESNCAIRSCVSVSRENDDNDCYAIAGSPLMQTVGRIHFLYGIASFGPTSCALKNIPDVFTNVANKIVPSF